MDTSLRKTSRTYRMAWIKRTAVASYLSLVIPLTMGMIGWAVPAASRADVVHAATHFSAPSFQVTPTPTPSSFQTTFAEMGHGERILTSPWGNAQYSFRLPDPWLVRQGSYLDLEFSYSYVEIGSELTRTSLGELFVYLDNRLLETYSLNESLLERVHLRVDLPPQLLNDNSGTYHQIELVLNAWFLCNTPHQAQLVVHPESTLFLDYTLLPLTLDLADYPRPFYRRSFDPDQVRFILPAQPSEAEMRSAAAIAAKLGDLTGNSTVISVTTDVDWLRMAEADQVGPEHLFVIGQPARNQLITWLNDNTTLPIPMRARELALSMRGPAAIVPGEAFSYTIAVTNTTPVPVTSFSLIDQLPHQARLVSCRPVCAETNGSEVSWTLPALSPGEVASFSLTLQLTDTVQLLSAVPSLENVVILANEAQVAINIRSLTTAIGPVPAEKEFIVSSGQDGYFFTQDGQPVPEGDGILQEIISPWDRQYAILLVTGVNSDAFHKASQSLGLENRFPEMKGPAALVREIRPSPPITVALETGLTLADLGYTDQTVYGVHEQELVYWFHVPFEWEITKDAYLRLAFSHSEAIDEQVSMLTVLLNGAPLATVTLDQENATEGSLQVHLPDSHIQRGSNNKISIRASMDTDRDRCKAIDFQQIWLSISQESLLHLDHRMQDVNVLDLDAFPFPFHTQVDLSDVLFVLPPVPGLVEQEALLQLAAVLGNAAGGTWLSPAVYLGEVPGVEMLDRYHVVVIGRPTINPMIQQINPLLPQPFVPGTDEVEHQVGEVLLRLSPDTPLGYIQEIPSPWNAHRALLVVTGTTDEGVAWATHALSHQMWRLKGNLALVREGEEGIEIQSIDTRGLTRSGLASVAATAVPELTPVATVTPAPEGGPTSSGTSTPTTPSPSIEGEKSNLPTWVMAFAGATAVVVLVILGGAVWWSRQRQGR